MQGFRQIKGHKNAYIVGADGSIYNQKTGRKLKATKGSNGYLHVTLCYGEKECCSIHRLVAEAFIENPDNLPCINHKDENKENNNVDNLEWCTQQYNANYGQGSLKRNSAIVQRNANGDFIKRWDSMKEASKILGLKYQGISRVCRGKRKTCGGYKWEYEERGCS